PETGTFGVFTDSAATDNQLEAGVSSDIYIWDGNTTQGSEAPFEGDNVIAWAFNAPGNWFGGGIQARQATDMSNFADGDVTFRIKIPADVSFKIGVTDTYSNENWVEFPASTNQYGLVRDGNWGLVTIPVADLRGDLIALQSMQYMFTIASVDGQLPTSTFQMAIDDIVWQGGGSDPVADADGDGVIDADDNCPNTPAGVEVDANGCEILVTPNVLVQAEDYTNYFDTSAGNNGGAYRTDNVDIEATTDVDGGFNVGWTDSGEWLEYSVTLGAGTYDVTTRVASAVGGGSYAMMIDGQSIGSDTVANTGGWQVFETHTVGTFTVEQGVHTVRIDMSTGLFNLNWFNIAIAATPVLDSDNDGVNDNDDLCPATPVGTTVDATGCAVVTSVTGITQISDTSVDFYVNSIAWADVHYSINGGGQQNFRMTFANGQNTKRVDGLSAGDAINYWFTYLSDEGPVVDTDLQTYTVTGGSTPVDTDGDGVVDGIDQCANTPTGTAVDSVGCPIVVVVDTDGDGVVDGLDQCANTPTGTAVDSVGCPIVVVLDEDNDGVIDGIDQCPGTPSGTQVDSVGCAVVTPPLGDIVPLYGVGTVLEQAIHFDRGDAIVTRFADRGRDRHAKEDHFQSYDHYLTHYWTHRTARFEFVDFVAKGGSTIEVNFVTEWKLGVKEFRAWYYGMNTVAEYHGNYENGVVEVGHGLFDDNLNQISTTGDQYKYSLTITQYRGLNGSVASLAPGQSMEIEVSQFLDAVPEGRNNYYGTTYLYKVGEGGLVPWKAVGDFADKSSERENSHPIDQSAWLGGSTTLPYGYTNEPDNHFMQMATNLSSINGQPFVLGRRIHHTDFETGQHDENVQNGIFAEMVGKAGTHYVNTSCSGCHERNGRAAPVDTGVELDKWVFKVGDANGNPDAQIGSVLQPDNVGIDDATQGEGKVSIASWTEVDGLRSPNYTFTKGTPAQFSARIAPQLVGLGLLEAIPETAILAREDVDDSKNGDGITGKAHLALDPVTGETRLGRFGYKAGTTSLKHQIAAAFNTDMGVMTSVLPQPDCGAAQTECGNSGAELADEHLDNLVKYIALLGVRPQRDIDDSQVQLGKALFTSIGCEGCHTETHQTSAYHPFTELRNQTIHPYTDLLLHDMGAGLADSLAEGQATGAEWRTTPLWGLGLSACVTGGVTNPTGGQGNEVCNANHSYLHDGRARSIEEAVLWHGGEGENAKVAYQGLSAGDKAALMAFLGSL
ncbi:MAG: carbohydrate-binding protein, partial [Algicola sp.]|nr:carbohydrate-binding protein [Algicola sp.]